MTIRGDEKRAMFLMIVGFAAAACNLIRFWPDAGAAFFVELRVTLLLTSALLAAVGFLGAVEMGKTVVLTRDGCEIRYLFLRRQIPWAQMKCRMWVPYTVPLDLRNPGGYFPKGGIWMSAHEKAFDGRRMAYESRDMRLLSHVCIHFAPPEGMELTGAYRHGIPGYMVDREAFLAFMKEIDLNIEFIEQAK